jgi:serine/threonine-protein kinase
VRPIAADDALRPGTLVADRYRLVRLIEHHDMAEVWEARDEVLARAVALKALHRHLAGDPALRERFRRDAVAAARLTHPNIVDTFDTGTDSDTTFMVMELVRGPNLRQVLAERKCLSASEAVVVAAQVARALDHARRTGLAHHAVRAGNVLLCDDGSWPGRVKVTDFGVAAGSHPSGDATQGEVGSSEREVAAVGQLLYEMLCGDAPDPEPAPLRLRRRRAGIPKPLEAVVTRALAPDGGGFASAGELAEALEAIELGDDAEPMVRREPTPPGGVPVLPREPRRSVVPLVLFVFAAALGVAVAALLVQTGGNGEEGSGVTPGAPLAVTAVQSFDPEGGDGEHEELVARAIDGKPETEWHSETYRLPAFGPKNGVGLILRLDRPRRVGQLEVMSPNRGWAARVYVADTAPTTLSEWGQPVAERRGLTGQVTFDLKGRQAGVVLLWFTDPGAGNQARVTEVVVDAS